MPLIASKKNQSNIYLAETSIISIHCCQNLGNLRQFRFNQNGLLKKSTLNKNFQGSLNVVHLSFQFVLSSGTTEFSKGNEIKMKLLLLSLTMFIPTHSR